MREMSGSFQYYVFAAFASKSPSSNNEDRPPASEEAFFQSGEEDIFRDIAATTGYIPPLSRMQRNLLRSIERYAFDAADNVKTVEYIWIAKYHRLENNVIFPCALFRLLLSATNVWRSCAASARI